MNKDKVSDIREGEEIFLSYLEDNGQVVSGYFKLIKLSDTLLEIKSNSNIIIIPISRLIKIKQRYEGGNC